MAIAGYLRVQAVLVAAADDGLLHTVGLRWHQRRGCAAVHLSVSRVELLEWNLSDPLHGTLRCMHGLQSRQLHDWKLHEHCRFRMDTVPGGLLLHWLRPQEQMPGESDLGPWRDVRHKLLLPRRIQGRRAAVRPFPVYICAGACQPQARRELRFKVLYEARCPAYHGVRAMPCHLTFYSRRRCWRAIVCVLRHRSLQQRISVPAVRGHGLCILLARRRL